MLPLASCLKKQTKVQQKKKGKQTTTEYNTNMISDDRDYLTVLDKSYDRGYKEKQKGANLLDMVTIWWMCMEQLVKPGFCHSPLLQAPHTHTFNSKPTCLNKHLWKI